MSNDLSYWIKEGEWAGAEKKGPDLDAITRAYELGRRAGFLMAYGQVAILLGRRYAALQGGEETTPESLLKELRDYCHDSRDHAGAAMEFADGRPKGDENPFVAVMSFYATDKAAEARKRKEGGEGAGGRAGEEAKS